jgi:hypothetical protein
MFGKTPYVSEMFRYNVLENNPDGMIAISPHVYTSENEKDDTKCGVEIFLLDKNTGRLLSRVIDIGGQNDPEDLSGNCQPDF